MGSSDPERSRRAFVRDAVAVGGAAALSACITREEADVPRGRDDPSGLPDRQHAWNASLERDEHGNHVPPRHHVVVSLDYRPEGPPTAADRRATERAFRRLERAYEHGNRGLLFTVGYSPAYFERFDRPLPPSVELPEPRALSPFEDPALDRPDAVVHLASDRGSVVLAAERALLGERDRINGVEAAPLGAFERVDRRTGFVGAGLPAAHQDVGGIPDGDPVPDDAPLYMGFESGFERNQAGEDRVTIPSGPFAGGTTQQLSRIRLRLADWYGEHDHDERVAEMFCPVHAAEDRVEGTGENLGTDTGVEECADAVADHAREYGRVGHAQKAARAREDGAPVILRRDFDSTDGDEAGVHFLSLQRSIAEFVATREAVNGTDAADAAGVRTRVDNGILEYTFVERRGNYLLPPRPLRALPPSRPA